MGLELIALSKLVRLFLLPENKLIAELRTDIRAEIAAERGFSDGGGGHFQMPFWAAAKRHVVGSADLHDEVSAMIEINWRRRRLYPLLRDGFLLWFNERRRWTNAPFRLANSPRARLQIDANTTAKVENVMAVSDAAGEVHYVYPYFSELPPLTDEGARLVLWALTSAFPNLPPNELRVLDIIRGNAFSVSRFPLRGDESDIFHAQLSRVRRLRRRLRREYE